MLLQLKLDAHNVRDKIELIGVEEAKLASWVFYEYMSRNKYTLI